MFLKTIDWKAIEMSCVTIICGLHFRRTSRINYEKYDEKYYEKWYISILSNMCNYQKHLTFEGMKNCNKANNLKTRVF